MCCTVRDCLVAHIVQVSGLDEINASVPVELQLQLLITIGRTARIARFIRASTVVKTSSKVNWYWLYQRINPLWYWQSYRRKSSRQLSSNSLDGDATDAGYSTGGNRSRGLVRQASWGGVQLGVLAAVKKAHLEEGKKPVQKEQGFRGFTRRILRGIGLIRNDDEEIRRQIAATKIQRAWRATVNQHGRHAGHADASEDEAWAPTFRSHERSLHRQNVPRQYSNVNHVGVSRKRTVSFSATTTRRYGRNNAADSTPESQVGSAMRELTGQRVAIGIIVALVLTVLFTYSENDATRPSTMVVLYNQTAHPQFARPALDAAVRSSIPDLYEYQQTDGTRQLFNQTKERPERLREREKLQITVKGTSGDTVGHFAYRNERRNQALVELVSTVFILLVWFFGVTAFAGPVMTLVVVPIERMVRLLGMLMRDPLGYQSTPRYKKFVAEEDELTKNTRWTKEVLKGMET